MLPSLFRGTLTGGFAILLFFVPFFAHALPGSCAISDLSTLKACFNDPNAYSTFEFTSDISCTGASCCRQDLPVMDLVGVSGKVIEGNGHVFHRSGSFKSCPALSITGGSSNITVKDLVFDEDEHARFCEMANWTKCMQTILVRNATGVTFDSIGLYYPGWVGLWALSVEDFTLKNSTIVRAGTVGVIVGSHEFDQPGTTVSITDNVFARSHTSGLFVEKAQHVNVRNNIFTQNHYWGIYPLPGGIRIGGGQSASPVVEHYTFANNLVAGTYCYNCGGAHSSTGTELAGIPGTLNSVAITGNTYIDLYGDAVHLNTPTTVGSNFTVTGNTFRRINDNFNHLRPDAFNWPSTVASNNTTVEPQPSFSTQIPPARFPTNVIYRTWDGVSHGESQEPQAPGGMIEQGFKLSPEPRIRGPRLPLMRCISTTGDYVSNTGSCGSDTLYAVLGYSWAATDASAQALYACQSGTDHFVSFDAACEGKVSGGIVGYAKPLAVGGVSSMPSASLLADGVSYIELKPGDVINYFWNSMNGVSAQSTYTTDTPACGSTTTGPFPWSVGNTLDGSWSGPVGGCAAGHTYTFTYRVTDAAGRSADSVLVMKVLPPDASGPTAGLVIDGYQAYHTSVGQGMRIAWTSTGGVTAKGTYSTDTPACGKSGTGPYDWQLGNTLDGSWVGTVDPCAAGHTFDYTYEVTDAAGRKAQAFARTKVATSTVNPGALEPTASLKVNGGSSYTGAPADILTFDWKAVHTGTVRATYTTDAPICGNATTGPFPWSFGNTPRGSWSGPGISPCLEGHTATITFTATDLRGKVATSSITVTGAPNMLSAMLKVNGASAYAGRPGDTVTFDWSSIGGVAASSTVRLDAPACGYGTTTQPWVLANTLSGSWTGSGISDCAIGRTSFITYSVINAAGKIATSSITVTALPPI